MTNPGDNCPNCGAPFDVEPENTIEDLWIWSCGVCGACTQAPSVFDRASTSRVRYGNWGIPYLPKRASR